MASSSCVLRARQITCLLKPNILAKSNYFSRRINRLPLQTSSFCRKYSESAAKGRLFSKKHEWVEVDANTGVVGISQFAQEALGDVVYAQLPEVGNEVKRDDEVGALESVKAASELYSPVSGKIIEVNKKVEDTPGLINQSCYKEGWLFKIQLNDDASKELDDLMNESQYEEFLKIENA